VSAVSRPTLKCALESVILTEACVQAWCSLCLSLPPVALLRIAQSRSGRVLSAQGRAPEQGQLSSIIPPPCASYVQGILLPSWQYCSVILTCELARPHSPVPQLSAFTKLHKHQTKLSYQQGCPCFPQVPVSHKCPWKEVWSHTLASEVMPPMLQTEECQQDCEPGAHPPCHRRRHLP